MPTTQWILGLSERHTQQVQDDNEGRGNNSMHDRARQGRPNYRVTDQRESNADPSRGSFARIRSANFLFRVSQDRRVNVPGGGDAARGVVGGFLKQVTGVSARPFPFDLVRRSRAIESLPPGQVCLASKTAVHRFDDVSGVSKHIYLARLRQRFEPDCRRRNLRLLVGRDAQVFTDGAPETFVAQQRHCRRATRNLSIPETRAVAENRDLLERSAFVVPVAHD